MGSACFGGLGDLSRPPAQLSVAHGRRRLGCCLGSASNTGSDALESGGRSLHQSADEPVDVHVQIKLGDRQECAVLGRSQAAELLLRSLSKRWDLRALSAEDTPVR